MTASRLPLRSPANSDAEYTAGNMSPCSEKASESAVPLCTLLVNAVENGLERRVLDPLAKNVEGLRSAASRP